MTRPATTKLGRPGRQLLVGVGLTVLIGVGGVIAWLAAPRTTTHLMHFQHVTGASGAALWLWHTRVESMPIELEWSERLHAAGSGFNNHVQHPIFMFGERP